MTDLDFTRKLMTEKSKLLLLQQTKPNLYRKGKIKGRLELLDELLNWVIGEE